MDGAVHVSTMRLERAAEAVVGWASDAVPPAGFRYVCATSAHGIVIASKDDGFRRILNRAAMVTADGMPLVWLGRLAGNRWMRRVYGPDLMKAVCERAAGSPIGHFFYGGATGVPELLATRLSDWYPGLRVVGVLSPPFRPLKDHELDSVARRIDDSGADVVWVGLSTPKQERWIDAMRQRVRGVKVMLSVGAAFDFHAGRVRQAPRLLQSMGLEWLFRMLREPRRLASRYAYNNPRFAWLLLLQIVGLRRFILFHSSDGAVDV